MNPDDTTKPIVFEKRLLYNILGKVNKFFFIHRNHPLSEKASSEMAVLFSCLKVGEMRLDMAEPKTIYCPCCGWKVFHYDGKRTINPMGKCKKCDKLVIYDIEKDEVVRKKIPKRECSSGLRFF